jgi:hypothetical protein
MATMESELLRGVAKRLEDFETKIDNITFVRLSKNIKESVAQEDLPRRGFADGVKVVAYLCAIAVPYGASVCARKAIEAVLDKDNI